MPMPGLATPKVMEPEAAIVKVLEESNGDLTLIELVERVQRYGITNEAVVKATVLKLVDNRQVQLTPERAIHLAR